MQRTTIRFIAVSLIFFCGEFLIALTPYDVSSMLSEIKAITKKDKNLKDFFLDDDLPEAILTKARISAQATSEQAIAKELTTRLIPALEALLKKQAEQETAQKNQIIAVAPAQQETKSLETSSSAAAQNNHDTHTTIEKKLNETTVVNKNVEPVKNEVEVLKIQEQKPFALDQDKLMKIVEQAKKDSAAYEEIVDSIKDQLVIYCYDVGRLTRNVTTIIAAQQLPKKITNAQAAFTQRLNAVERNLAAIEDVIEQLQDACGNLELLAQDNPTTMYDVQKKQQQGQSCTDIILKKKEALHIMLENLKKNKKLVLQTKSDLEQKLKVVMLQG